MGNRRKKERFVCWDTSGPTSRGIRVEPTEHFDARGMRHIYGQGDHFGHLVLNMDVWRGKNGRALARFWSRSQEVDGESYEVFGLDVPDLGCDHVPADGECWVSWPGRSTS